MKKSIKVTRKDYYDYALWFITNKDSFNKNSRNLFCMYLIDRRNKYSNISCKDCLFKFKTNRGCQIGDEVEESLKIFYKMFPTLLIKESD